MKICVNYWGELRNLEITIKVFNNFIKDNINEFYVLLTTWEEQANLNDFLKLFPHAKIKLLKKNPDISKYSNILDNFKMDCTNPFKSIHHYVLGLYIKNNSKYIIEEYENEYNIEFDIIISIRTDIYIYDNHLTNFYNNIFENNKKTINNVYVGIDPCFNIYNEGALPDVICIGNKETIIKCLSHIDILEKCTLNNINNFHPETSFYKSLVNMNLNIYKLNFRAFPQLL